MTGFGLSLMGKDGWIRRLPPPLNAWTGQRDFPTFASQTFQERWQARRKEQK